MATRKEVKSRIASVKNVQQITRAMEMVAAARLRRAEERISHLRPYAQELRKMTRQVAEAVGVEARNLPVFMEHEQGKVGVLLVTGDRGLAGGFNSQIIRAGIQLQREETAEGHQVEFSVVGRRGASSMRFRGEELRGEYTGFTDRPAFSDARRISDELIADYVDEKLLRVDLIYNRYVSPLTQYVRRQTLLPIQQAEVFGEGVDEMLAVAEAERKVDEELAEAQSRSLWVYEPEPEELLAELVPEYAQLSVYRALLESTASEHGSRMTAMRSAADNAKEVIGDLTLEMNRVRQAEITQEILEVVGGAEALS
ncbi:MAG: ATP synthase F1 subunit gamma [Solirubrobacterales bacterium]